MCRTFHFVRRGTVSFSSPKTFRFIPSWLQNNLTHTPIYAYHQTFHLISSSIVSFFGLYNLRSHACIIVTYIFFFYSLYLMGCWALYLSTYFGFLNSCSADTIRTQFFPFDIHELGIHTSYPRILYMSNNHHIPHSLLFLSTCQIGSPEPRRIHNMYMFTSNSMFILSQKKKKKKKPRALVGRM